MHWYLDVLKKYVKFSGRASRVEFWSYTLINFAIIIALQVIGEIIKDNYILVSVYALAVFLPSISVSVRRLHDVGRSGWMMLIILIPIIGAIWLFVLNITPGNASENKYGPAPTVKD